METNERTRIGERTSHGGGFGSLSRASVVALSLMAAVSAGCGARAAAPREEAAAPALPRHVVATRTTVLRLPDDAKIRLATPRYELPLRVREVRGEEALVEIDGGIRVSGVVALDSLGVITCTPGPIADHFYAGDGNLLSLRSTVHDGRVRVAGDVIVRARANADGVPFEAQFRRMPFDAEIETSRLCTATPPKRHAGTAEDPTVAHVYGEPDEEDFPKGARLVDVEKGTSLTLLDAPAGKPLHTLPASEWGFVLVWLERRGAWDLVAAGGGPYLLGWIPNREPRKEDFGEGGLGLVGAIEDEEGPRSLATKDLRGLPLVRLPAGSTLQQLGVVRATLVRDGFARVSGEPRGAWSYVIAAVDDDVTAEGWIETTKLGPRVPPRAKPVR